MSFAPTAFRSFARGGFGGRAASYFRGLQAVDTQGRGQGRGQVGTVVFRSPGGFSNSGLTGVTRDSTGATLDNCIVTLNQGNIIKGQTTSDGAGNYTFLGCGSGPFFIVAYKAGSPDVAGTTVNTLQPTVV